MYAYVIGDRLRLALLNNKIQVNEVVEELDAWIEFLEKVFIQGNDFPVISLRLQFSSWEEVVAKDTNGAISDLDLLFGYEMDRFSEVYGFSQLAASLLFEILRTRIQEWGDKDFRPSMLRIRSTGFTYRGITPN